MSSERIEAFWRDATAADVLRVMNGEKVEARFRDSDGETWLFYRLVGWRSGLYGWLDEDLDAWGFCQIYDPPQWYVDKPEPGEGYRLLAKSPAEDLQEGDEVFEGGKWEPSRNLVAGFQQQSEAVWYRRRIEQPKPEPKFAVGQRVKIVGPVCVGGPIYNWTREMNEHVGVVGAVRLKPTQDPEGTFYAVGEIVGWSFREDYLEAVIEPKPEPKHYKLNAWDTADLPSGHRIIVTDHGIEVQ